MRTRTQANPGEGESGLNAVRLNPDSLLRTWVNWVQGTLNPQVPGSIPGWPTINAKNRSLTPLSVEA
jgi:hypothetical protein